MSVEERQQAEERREKKLNANLKSGKAVRVTLDFMGRRVIKEDRDEVVEDERKYKEEAEEAQLAREVEEAAYWQDYDLYGGKEDDDLDGLLGQTQLTGRAKEVYEEIRSELLNLPALLPSEPVGGDVLQHFTDPNADF